MLASYLAVLRRRRWALIVLVLIFESLIFGFLSSRPMVYQSIAVLEVGSTNLSDTLLGQTPAYVDPVRRAATESDVVMSAPVEALALEVLDDAGRLDDGGIPGTVKAAPRATSNYIDVVSTASTPTDAQAIADAFAASYLEHRLEKLRGESVVLEIRLTAGLQDAERDVARLEAADDADSLELTAARESVERTQDLIQNLRFLRSVNGSDVSLAFPAGLPSEPLNERSPAEAIGISLVGAIFLSLGIIFVLELLQDTVRSQEEAERLTSTPVLGVITRRSTRADRDARSMAAAHADWRPTAPGAGLRLGVLARNGGAMPASVLVTGLPEDGPDVSLVGWALASACADSGQEVLLVGDVAPDAPGGADLTTEPTVVDLGSHQLSVLRAAGTTVSWCPLTAADGTQGLLDVPFPKNALAQLASSFDLIVIASGTSGVRPTDLTHLAEVAIVVCSFGRTSARTLLELLEAFEHRGSGVLGLAATSAAPEGTKAGRRRLRRRSRDRDAPIGSAVDDGRSTRARQTVLAPASAVSPGSGASGPVGGDEVVPGGELVPEGATWNHAPVSEVGAGGVRRGTATGEGT